MARQRPEWNITIQRQGERAAYGSIACVDLHARVTGPKADRVHLRLTLSSTYPTSFELFCRAQDVALLAGALSALAERIEEITDKA